MRLRDHAGATWTLHPVHRRAQAADRRAAREARFGVVTGTFSIPLRTAVVFEQPAR